MENVPGPPFLTHFGAFFFFEIQRFGWLILSPRRLFHLQLSPWKLFYLTSILRENFPLFSQTSFFITLFVPAEKFIKYFSKSNIYIYILCEILILEVEQTVLDTGVRGKYLNTKYMCKRECDKINTRMIFNVLNKIEL